MIEINNKLLIVFILIGVVIFLFGIVFYLKLKNKLKYGIKTDGEIVNVKIEKTRALQGADELSDIYYKYEIKYNDSSNTKIVKWSDFQTQSKYDIGKIVEVIYNKENSEEFIIFPSSQKKLFIIFLFIGLVFLIIGTIILIK